jgi:hypothetical protein
MHEYDYDTFDIRLKHNKTYIIVSQRRFSKRYYAIYQWNSTQYVQVTAYTTDIDRTFDTCQFLEEQAYKKMTHVIPSTSMSN